jgi:uncharacterized phage protein (TIGR01671 family)
MRNIKFRAWIPTAKIMVSDGLMIGNFGEGEGSVLVDSELQSGEALKGLIWMQFTGLLDKNGKEVFEGDILKSEYGNIFEIKDMHLMWNEKEVEVIGNIYENPELLKKI